MKIEWGNCGNITTNIGFIYSGYSCLKEVLIKLVSSSIQTEKIGPYGPELIWHFGT